MATIIRVIGAFMLLSTLAGRSDAANSANQVPSSSVDFFAIEASQYEIVQRLVDAPQLSLSDAAAIISYAELTVFGLKTSRAQPLRRALSRVQREAPSAEERFAATFWNRFYELKEAENQAVFRYMKDKAASFNKPPIARSANAQWSTAAAALVAELKKLDALNERTGNSDRRQFNKSILDLEQISLSLPNPSLATFHEASRLYDRVAQRRSDSPQNSALLLSAAESFALIGTRSKAVSASVAIERLQRAISKSMIYWGRHPTILSADETIIAIASEAGSNLAAAPSFKRLGVNPDSASLSSVDPYQLSEDAFDLGGWSTGRGWLLAALKAQAVEKMPTTSDEWAESLQSRIDPYLALSTADVKIVALTAILLDPVLAPPRSPARRWALFDLASVYSDLGSQDVAVKLRKYANAMPMTAINSALFTATATESSVEIALNQHMTDPDVGLKADLYAAKIKLISKHGNLASADALLIATILVSYYAQLGATAEIEKLVDDIISSLEAYNQQSGAESTERTVSHLSSIVNLEDSIQLEGLIGLEQKISRAKERFAKTIILNEARRALSSGSKPDLMILTAISDAKTIAQSVRPWVVADSVFSEFIPWLVDEKKGAHIHDLSNLDLAALLQGLGDVATLVRGNALAARLNAAGQALGATPGKKNINDVCRILKSASKSNASDSVLEAADESARIRDSLRSLSCQDVVPADDYAAASTTWAEEEQRLRSGSPPNAPVSNSISLGEFGSCPMFGDAARAASDADRRQMLAMLDAERAQSLPNVIKEALILKSLADTYPSHGNLAPFELRHLAIGLLINGSTIDPVVLAAEAVCMAVAAMSANQKPALAAALEEVKEALRRQAPTDRESAFRRAFASRAKARPDLGEDFASLNVFASDAGHTEARATPSPRDAAREHSPTDATKDPRQVVLDGIAALRTTRKSLEPAALAAMVKRLAYFAGRHGGPGGELAGSVILFRAEVALSNGSLALSEQLVGEADNTGLAKVGEFDNVFADARARLTALDDWFAKKRNAAQSEAKVLAVANLLRKRGELGPLALAYRRMLDFALQAQDYPTVEKIFFALQSLDVDFIGNQEAFLAKAGLSEFLSGMASQCFVRVQEFQASDLKVGGCQDSVLRIAGRIAREQSAAERQRRQEKKDQSASPYYDFMEVLTAVAPFISDAGSAQVNDIQALLAWTVVQRQSGLDTAAQRRQQERASVTSIGSTISEVKEWQRAQAFWRSAAADLACATGGLASRDDKGRELIEAENAARANAESALFASMSHPALTLNDESIIDIQRMRDNIADDDVVLSYTLRDSKVVIWVVRKSHAALEIVDANDIRRQMALFYGNATSPGPFDLSPLRRLYELVISPIASELHGTRQLYIETDQEATAVPFAALIESPPPALLWDVSLKWTPAWLIERFAISRVPSLAGFSSQSDRDKSSSRELLAAGDPRFGPGTRASAPQPCASTEDPDDNLGNAPQAYEELENAIKIAGPGRGTLLSLGDFTREKLRGELRTDFGIIIFATHGTPESEGRPARLILSGPRRGAESLTARDVEALNLNADMVILSACDSALRSGVRMGLNDLVPAFFTAGARHVVAASWPLSGPAAKEVTSQLVSDYYNNQHATFAQSMQVATLSLANSSPGNQFRHPHFWAGFILFGAR